MTEENRFDLTIFELLELYKNAKKEFHSFVNTTFHDGSNSQDEILKKRNEKEYERLQEECKDIACFITERMIKNNLP